MAILRTRRAALAILTALCLVAASAAAQHGHDLERSVKSAYLFKLGAYVEWPPTCFPTDASPFVIGVLGEDPFGKALDEAIAGRTMEGRPVVVRRLHTVEEAAGVHVLYLGATSQESSEQIREALVGRPVLTVGEKAARSGAIVEFVLRGGKVKFEIDAGAASRAGLKLSSKLLDVALAVKS